jgi:3-oxoacyl-[acyl-carrier-protein] synthase II
MEKRIVITGIGLTSPIGNDLPTMRKNLLEGVSGIAEHEIRFMGKRPAYLSTVLMKL